MKTYYTTDDLPRARATDPDTSHIAAEEVSRDGTADNQRADCLLAVQKHPGLTAAEIARKTGLERHAPSRRLPELRDLGLVRNGTPRVCTVSGTKQMTWWPVEKQA